jgi:tRNA-splicing endonuclease subunit Sen34
LIRVCYSILLLSYLTLSVDIAVLVDDASAHLPPTDAQLERHVQVMQEEITRQTSQTQARMISEAQGQGRANSEQAQRKRREREQKRAADAARRAGLAIEDVAHFSPGPPADLLTPTPTRPDTPSNSASNHIPYVVQIPASSTSLDWYKTTNSVYDKLSAARDAGVWIYPFNESQRARCDVFRDLWEQGYFMGGGIKFGGDWLVYPGAFLSLTPEF